MHIVSIPVFNEFTKEDSSYCSFSNCILAYGIADFEDGINIQTYNPALSMVITIADPSPNPDPHEVASVVEMLEIFRSFWRFLKFHSTNTLHDPASLSFQHHFIPNLLIS